MLVNNITNESIVSRRLYAKASAAVDATKPNENMKQSVNHRRRKDKQIKLKRKKYLFIFQKKALLFHHYLYICTKQCGN